MAFRVGSGVLLTALLLLLLLFYSRTSSAFGNDGFPFRITLTYEQFEKLRDGILNIIGRTGDSPRLLQRAARLNKLQPTVPYDQPFPCDTSGYRSPTKPTSVHRVRPGDVDIVGALGDSLTAGNGAAASEVFHVYTENRGISWSIGGKSTWREYLTLPNILKEFNPKLFGYSLADSFTHHRASQFNVGEIGAMSNDLPFMARQLIKRIKSDPRVDLQNDWKLLTILMGSNDFCLDLCYVDAQAAPERHRKNLITTLELIRKNLPRTIVQIVVSPNLGLIITRFRGVSPTCQFTHSGECPCLFGLAYTNRQREYIDVMRRWQQAELDVADDPRFKGYDDFAVVAQTFTFNVTFPETVDRFGNRITDFSYLSEDCFHFSQKGYSRAANALWNNMLQRVGEKSTNWQMEFTHFICPTTESPYIYTYGNS